MDLRITQNNEKNRFETHLQGKVAFIDYFLKNGVVYLTHTEVPKEFEGKGIGSALVKYTLEHLKKEEAKVISQCPFVTSYIKRHPEFQELLASE